MHRKSSATAKSGRPATVAAVLNHTGVKPHGWMPRSFLRAERAAQPQVDEGLSYPLLQAADSAASRTNVLLVTGFIIAATTPGKPVLLGRNQFRLFRRPRSARWRGVPASTIWSDVGRGLQRGSAQSERCLPAAAAASG